MARSALALLALPLAVLPLVQACDLFAIRCDEDPDCPADLPACFEGICLQEAEAERRGRPVQDDEPIDDGTCASDDECAAGLCYDLTDAAAHFEAGLVGTCVPGIDDSSDCPEANTLGLARETGGAAIFAASATRQAGDCSPGSQNLQLEVLYLDREGDFDLGSSIEVMQPGGTSPDVGSGSISGDGTSGAGFFFIFGCVPDNADHVAVRVAPQSGPKSNALCVALPPLDP